MSTSFSGAIPGSSARTTRSPWREKTSTAGFHETPSTATRATQLAQNARGPRTPGHPLPWARGAGSCRDGFLSSLAAGAGPFALLLPDIRAEAQVGFGKARDRYGERVTDRSDELGVVRARLGLTGGLEGFPPDRLPDPDDEVLGALGRALHPHDVLEFPGELGALPAGAAGPQVRREDTRTIGVELSVEIVLDLSQDLFAA